MPDPCVEDTSTVHLDTEGTPAVLFASVLELARSFSGTMGDLGQHIVTDVAVVHQQTATFNVVNPFPDHDVTGIVIASMDPIYLVPGPTGTQYTWETHLHVDGVDQDPQSGVLDWAFATASQDGFYIPLRAKLGQLSIPAGGTAVVIMQKQIQNFGVSQTWEYNLGGDKLEAVFGP